LPTSFAPIAAADYLSTSVAPILSPWHKRPRQQVRASREEQESPCSRSISVLSFRLDFTIYRLYKARTWTTGGEQRQRRNGTPFQLFRAVLPEDWSGHQPRRMPLKRCRI